MGLYAGSNGSLSPATADANANGMVSSGVMEWNEDRVAEFFTGVGLPKYDEAIKGASGTPGCSKSEPALMQRNVVAQSTALPATSLFGSTMTCSKTLASPRSASG